jgi:Leishmanolysin
MNPASYFNPVFSGMNFVLMEALGFYQGNRNMEEHLEWGYKGGCALFKIACFTHPNYCSGLGSKICSLDHYTLGSCQKDVYSENCTMFNKTPKGDCKYESNRDELAKQGYKGVEKMYFGNKSRCIMGIIDNESQGDGIVCGLNEGCNAKPNCMKHICAEDKRSL